MYLSINWLSEYVEHGLSADALADLLTRSGLEVEGVERGGPALDGVVVGRVVDVRPHPDADRLQVCDVDLGGVAGADGPVQIVCGAPNVAAGQAVPVATVGTVLDLPARDGSGVELVTIKKGKIRGQVSNGMICAEDELGIGTDHDGILVLDGDAVVGQPFADYLAEHGRGGDAVLDVNVTPNRPDATSHVGVARDVAALLDKPLRRPAGLRSAPPVPGVGGAVADLVSVEIDVPDACPRFVGMVVENVTVGESPEWLKERLVSVGLRPISNVVDVTNFVMLETGQPLHAYDLDRLEGGRVRVVAAEGGEAFTTLDGVERKLPAGTVMVADGERFVGVAGVMGGADSEVTEATTTVFIEGAMWEPSQIRRTAKALGLQTDASYRFERGADPTGQPFAVARAADLVAQTGGGVVVDGRIDENPRPYAPRTVRLRPARVARVLGVEVPVEDIARLLTAIGFGVEGGESGLEVTVPPFRPDVEREVDVIEEVARLWGYDRLPTPTTTAVPLVPAGDTPSARLLARSLRRLAALGFRETYTNSLVSRPTAEAFADAAWTGAAAPPVETLNPISQEMAALRPSLLPGLLAVASYNQARGAGSLRLMESGHVYRKAAGADENGADRNGAGGVVDGYHEHRALALGMSGAAVLDAWDRPARETDVYDLKGVVVDLLADLGITGVTETPRPAPDALTAYALVLEAGGRRLGVLGRVSDAVADAADLQAPLFAAELDWDAVVALADRDAVVAYEPISRHPVVERDLAVVVPEAQPAGPLLETIRRAGRPLLQDVRLFDLYRGEGVEAGHKSLAFALRFGADRTLRDKEVDGRVRRVVKALGAEHGAGLRG
ncbi:phenylalanine--tRNA ligase subunit beta [Rubrivirga litoralis]|uniref:Phenylalanine--tRNA ligase beta subunit n=1 Tax=Rubrivirga litoralis TaxID=3075598 RepID=A0ABU3BTM8_9BACT|nr:phenylalanine--tRNA ligase subunit beta [Rubrivirga sp. F394]MDT0632642.1 phenylalanine--tRNA ligase subunit beta [Rubrivirga sp. F394]